MIRSLALLAVLAIAIATAAPADDLLEDRGNVWPPFFAELQDVELQGDRAYVFGVGGLIIFDVSDPDAPVLLGRWAPADDRADRLYRGAVSGEFGYGGARESGLVVVHLQPETAPVLVDRIEAPSTSYEGCTVANGYLFACRHADGLEIFSLADPAAPAPVSALTSLTNAWDVEVQDGVAYVADGAGGLSVVDVSDPDLPVLLANVPTAGAAADVALAGDVAVVAIGSAGLEIYDVTDPADPQLLASHNTSGLAATIAIDAGLVYVADWDDIEVVDITTPSLPVAAGRENTPVRGMGLAAAAGRVYVADWSRLRIYDHGPTTRGDIELPRWFEFGPTPHGAVVDTVLAVGNTGGGTLTVHDIQIYDTDFELMPPLSFTVPPGEQHEVAIRYTNADFGEDITFIRIESDDTDEGVSTFPVVGEPDPDQLDLGDPAPPFTLTDLDGVTHELAQYRGRVVVLAFFANW